MQDIYTARGWEAAEVPEIASEHPGAYLRAEYLEPLGLTIQQMANDLSVPYPRMHEVVNGKRAITPETAILLAKYFNTSPQFWLGLQTQFDLDMLRGKVGEKLARVRVLERPTPAERIAAGEAPAHARTLPAVKKKARAAEGGFTMAEPDES